MNIQYYSKVSKMWVKSNRQTMKGVAGEGWYVSMDEDGNIRLGGSLVFRCQNPDDRLEFIMTGLAEIEEFQERMKKTVDYPLAI